MAGFRKDATTAAQTAANVAGAITAAQIAARDAGLTLAEAQKYVVGIFKALFAELEPVVKADNEVFAAAEAEEAVRGGGSRTRKPTSKGSAKGETPADPGDVAFFGGKFKGCTIREVYEMTAEEAKETYGHQYGSGDTYIRNYVATDKNTNETTREAARVFLAEVTPAEE